MNLLTFVFLLVTVSLVSSAGLVEEFTWTRITYDWPKDEQAKKSRYISSFRPTRKNPDVVVFDGETNLNETESASSETGLRSKEDLAETIDYRYENNIPMGANVWKNKLFIGVPRRRLGVPSTLNYVPLDSPNRHNTPLIPYPNWNLNLYPDATGTGDNLVSVYRVGIDPCDRMWLVDTGLIEILGNATRVKPASLIVIDLNTDQIIHRYEIPQENLRPSTALVSVTIDVTKDTCDDAYIYLPDLAGYGLVVYSFRENRSWRVTHNYFYLEPNRGEFFISGHHFQWNDGVFSVELTALHKDGFRDMYFHSMAGTHMYRVSTRFLRNESLAVRSYHENDFKAVGDRGEGAQTSSADIHKPSGIMFLGLVNQNALGCWNIHEPLNTISVVQKDDQKMIYPCDVKVRGDKIYMLTNTMPEFLYGRLNYDQVNFRIWSNSIERAVHGTRCRARGGKYN